MPVAPDRLHLRHTLVQNEVERRHAGLQLLQLDGDVGLPHLAPGRPLDNVLPSQRARPSACLDYLRDLLLDLFDEVSARDSRFHLGLSRVRPQFILDGVPLPRNKRYIAALLGPLGNLVLVQDLFENLQKHHFLGINDFLGEDLRLRRLESG